MFRIKQRIQRALRDTQLVRSGNFTQMLQISVYDDGGLSYKMPDSIRASQSIEW